MSQTYSPLAPYQMLLEQTADVDRKIDNFCLGLTWSYCRSRQQIGFAMSPGVSTRTLEWPGTVAGQRLSSIAQWLLQWDPFAATAGLAAVNATINGPDNTLLSQSMSLIGEAPANLAVFEYFRPRMQGLKVVVIGRYPGLTQLLAGVDVTVLERVPGEHDLPDPAAEFLLPQADWVFLTATSLINKTFPRLAALARDAVTVLMGPSTPWLASWSDFHIDFLAGVQVVDRERSMQIAMEGGGIRLFGDGVRYALADIGAARLDRLRREIGVVAEQRVALRSAMEAWYAAGNAHRFPRHAELAELEATLSTLDTTFKRLWDARLGS